MPAGDSFSGQWPEQLPAPECCLFFASTEFQSDRLPHAPRASGRDHKSAFARRFSLKRPAGKFDFGSV